jgi:DNA polymerase sigma
VKVFGSQMTKILTPSSDLDIAILNVPEESGNAIDLLYELEKEIRAKGKKSDGIV